MIVFIVNPILIIAAVLPAVALMIYVYRSDRLESESPQLILTLVLQGIVATSLAAFTESIGAHILGWFLEEDTILYNAIFFFLIVALSEEGFKYLLLKDRTWNSRAFNCQFDGVVYAVSVSLGFALWENIQYVILYGFEVAVLRAVTAVPGHACFGVFMGAWYGLAKRYANAGEREKSERCLKLALLTAVLLHGCYDFIASIDIPGYGWIFFAFVLVMFVISWLTVRKLSKNDRYIGRR